MIIVHSELQLASSLLSGVKQIRRWMNQLYVSKLVSKYKIADSSPTSAKLPPLGPQVRLQSHKCLHNIRGVSVHLRTVKINLHVL